MLGGKVVLCTILPAPYRLWTPSSPIDPIRKTLHSKPVHNDRELVTTVLKGLPALFRFPRVRADALSWPLLEEVPSWYRAWYGSKKGRITSS